VWKVAQSIVIWVLRSAIVVFALTLIELVSVAGFALIYQLFATTYNLSVVRRTWTMTTFPSTLFAASLITLCVAPSCFIHLPTKINTIATANRATYSILGITHILEVVFGYFFSAMARYTNIFLMIIFYVGGRKPHLFVALDLHFS